MELNAQSSREVLKNRPTNCMSSKTLTNQNIAGTDGYNSYISKTNMLIRNKNIEDGIYIDRRSKIKKKIEFICSQREINILRMQISYLRSQHISLPSHFLNNFVCIFQDGLRRTEAQQ